MNWCIRIPGATSGSPAALSSLQRLFEPMLRFLFALCKIRAPPGAKACCSHQCSQTVCVKGKALLSLCAYHHFLQVMAPA